MKAADLTDRALDWAVATAQGGTGLWYDTIATYWIKIDGKDRALSKGWSQSFTPSTDWAQGGPIIELEGISVYEVGGIWKADIPGVQLSRSGPTPLVAAMRCYVASKLGDDITIPKELM